MPNTASEQPTPPVHAMTVETVGIEDVQPMPGNPRIGHRPLLAASLDEHGQYKPVIAQRSSGHIIAGNNTWHAAHDRGDTEIAVQWLDVDDDRAKRINLIDNRASDRATYDDRLLLEFLSEMPDLDGTGYDPGDLDALSSLLDNDTTSNLAGGDDQDVLDDTDKAAWPIIRAQVPPDIYQRWGLIDGDDDATRVRTILDVAGY